MRLLFAICLLTPVCAADLTVAAASDLARAGPALAAAYQHSTGQGVRFSYGSSGLLARQIENGAPFDVYLAANESFVDEQIAKGGLAAGSKRIYALGWLAIWSKSGSFEKLADLARPGVLHIAVANPAHAPYGAAAVQALKRTGLWDALKDKIVYGENIRQTLQYAESGNTDAALVAWSLVFDRGGKRIPETLHDPIRQAGGVVSASRQQGAAGRFLDFLRSASGKAVLGRYGFQPL